jgi:glycine/D-amino acid oxidase-like deaminating enzyme
MNLPDDTRVEDIDTLIVGGGISGLACARQLYDAGREFVLVTEDVGGRVALSERGHCLGAVIINDDYVHVRKYAEKAFVSRPWNTYIWQGSKGVNAMFRLNPLKLAKLNRVFGEFREALNRLRASAPYSCQKELMEADPLLSKLVAQTATGFVREQGLESLAEGFLGPVVSAVFLCDWREITAFHFCIGVSCTGNGAFNADWSNTIERLTRGYADKIVLDKVISINELNGGDKYQVLCGERTYRASKVVLSVPGPAASSLLSIPLSARDVFCSVFHIEGKRRALYRPRKTLLMGAHHDIELFFPLPDGIDVVYASEADPDLDRYYESHSVIARRSWQPATQMSGSQWRPLQAAPNLFTIGDYNICGLEDAYLTGMFAANKIIVPGTDN